EAGYDILVHCNFARSPKEIYQFLNGGLADGLILFAPQASDPLLALLRKSALPVVILSGRDVGKLFPSVADDVQAGMKLVSDALVKNGHKRIAVLTDGAGAARDSDVRVRLLRQNLAEHGIELPARWIIPAISRDMAFLAPLMAEAEPPTAIFCWHDRLAYSVLAACEALEIQIPQQLSIVGYDGLYWPSATRHQAASVRVDPSALARTSVQILDDLINGYQGPLREELVPVSFVSGTSLGPAACNGAINESSHLS
ncbi:MAG TPA: substrate-binding domain-containing protein, partial [Fimbriimonadaceae bacterium]|nr:substrate-binding domain-containing protein [Fimbriimonadaceae bacterium]